jgi:hypothetical protein
MNQPSRDRIVTVVSTPKETASTQILLMGQTQIANRDTQQVVVIKHAAHFFQAASDIKDAATHTVE